MGNAKNDLNPFRSSLFTGAGLPWGAMETGRPDAPQFESYMTPDQAKGMDFGKWAKAEQEQAALAGGDAERDFGARASKYMGGAGSSSADNARRVGSIMAQTQKNFANIAADRQMQEFNSRVTEANSVNNARQMANQLKADQYNRDAAEFNAEQQARGGLISGGLGILGTIGGGIVGGMAEGPMGAIAGASAGGGIGSNIGNMFTGGRVSSDIGAQGAQMYDLMRRGSNGEVNDGYYADDLDFGFDEGNTLALDPELEAARRRSQRLGGM